MLPPLTLLIPIISGVCALLAPALNGVDGLLTMRIVGLSAPDRTEEPYPMCDIDDVLRPPGEVDLMCTVGTGIMDRLGGRGG